MLNGIFYPQKLRLHSGLVRPTALTAGNQAWEPNKTIPPGSSALELHPGKTLQWISKKAFVNSAFVGFFTHHSPDEHI